METGQDPSPQGLPVASHFLPHCWGHRSLQKKGWAPGPGGFLHWQCFCNTTATVPFVYNIARIPESLGVLEVPALQGTDFVFLKVASRAELLMSQALRGQESSSDDVCWKAGLLSGPLLCACHTALQSPSSHRTNHLRQDSHLALAPTWLLLYWIFGEGGSVFRTLENIPEAPGPSPASCSLLTSGLMRPQVQKLEFGEPR